MKQQKQQGKQKNPYTGEKNKNEQNCRRKSAGPLSGPDCRKSVSGLDCQPAPGRKQNPESQDNKEQREAIKETGDLTLSHRIHLLSVIGEVEGHECLPNHSKTTKYEHILPRLAAIEDSPEIDGLLILLNTVGGDVEAGLAIAEMIASLSKPTVSLVLGGSHSIGVPIAVSTDYSFIVRTGTMVIHPVRMNGTVIGAPQTYDYFKQMQNRILGFISAHSRASRERLEELMLDTGILTKDLGTILVGEDAVKEGLIDEIGGISQALHKLNLLIEG